MAKTYSADSRTIQTLRLLNEHGALSSQTIRQLVLPECTKQYAKWMLGKLKRNGLVRTRNDRIFGRSGIFYELRSEDVSRATVANLIGESLSNVRLNNGVNRELLHADEQALWIQVLRRQYPLAQVYPELSFFRIEAIQNLLPSLSRSDAIEPDIVMLPKGAYSAAPFSIAIEIERTLKSKKRIKEKLLKYAQGSKFDGVLYICSNSGIEESIRKIFLNSHARQAVRIQNYSDHFLAFGKLIGPSSEITLYTAGVASKSFALSDWIKDLGIRRSSWDALLQQDKDYPR